LSAELLERELHRTPRKPLSELVYKGKFA